MAIDMSAYIGTNNMFSVAKSNEQIIPYYAHPHVHTVIVDNSGYEETVAPQNSLDDLPYSKP